MLALGDDTLRWTVGKLEVAPGSVNTIADRVVFSIDLRHPAASGSTRSRRCSPSVPPACGAVARSA